ncbi:uncharacterized protein [Rhodnius prolixus]|uniref:uncharacterized protein n=1 Tax=Rhodnius prolixus TaxID=13249 RepID=UPI003D188A5B
MNALNATLWSKEIGIQTKRKIYHSFVESVATYAAENWTLSRRAEGSLLALEMDFWRRSCGVSRLQRIPNSEIREKAKVEKTILYTIETKRLKWYGHLMRMDEDRWPRRIHSFTPQERRKRGRPRKRWMEGVEQAMAARGLREGDWEDRERWLLGIGDMTV